ncbi:MAG: hypothetical protein HQ530_02975 [Parcubacteria group bacterium]|nr:hypothetical protein [Parcubacteria group bacterium]
MEIVRTTVGWVMSLTTANVVVIVIVVGLLVAGLIASRPKIIEAIGDWIASSWVMSLTITSVVVTVVVIGLIGFSLNKCNDWTEQDVKIVSVVDPDDPDSDIMEVVWKEKVTMVGAMWSNCGLPKTLYKDDAFIVPRLFILGFEEGAVLKSGANRGGFDINITPQWLKPATKRLTKYINLSFNCQYTLYF